jgi:hypothetical protein
MVGDDSDFTPVSELKAKTRIRVDHGQIPVFA